VEFGGLHIIGTERHEARRIDNQLRGRAGRQGDPGNSRFFVSIEDDIVKRFGGDRIKGIMEWAGLDEDTPIENKLINRSIESAQVRVEGYHFDMRKHLVEYDDVVNQQREIIYDERRKMLGGADLKANILSMVGEEIQHIVAIHIPDERGIDQDIEGLLADVSSIFPLPPEINAGALAKLKPQQIADKLIELAEALYEAREKEIGSDGMRTLERLVMLHIMDSLWIEHLTMMEDKRQEAGWQTLRQVKAVDAYRNLGYDQFHRVLLPTIKHEVAHTIYRAGIRREAPAPVAQGVATRGSDVSAGQATTAVSSGAAMASPLTAAGSRPPQPVKASHHKVGRNDPCPCGSGKKYKKCCGR